MIHHDGSTRNRPHMLHNNHKAVAPNPVASLTPLVDLWSDSGSLQGTSSSLHKLSPRLHERAAMRKYMPFHKAHSMEPVLRQQHNRCSTLPICMVQMHRDRATAHIINNMGLMSCTAWRNPHNRRHNRLMTQSHVIPSVLVPRPRHWLLNLGRHKRQQHSITLQDSRFRVRQFPSWRHRNFPLSISLLHTRPLDLRPLTRVR